MVRTLLLCLLSCLTSSYPLAAKDVSIDLDLGNQSAVHPRIDDQGFALEVEYGDFLQKLERVRIHLKTRQIGTWAEPVINAGKFLEATFDPSDPRRIEISTRIRWNPRAGENRYNSAKAIIEATVRAGVKQRGKKAANGLRKEALLNAVATIRAENIEASRSQPGFGSRNPAQPIRPTGLEKLATLDKVLKQHCRWQNVARLFNAIGFEPPDGGFVAADAMAREIHQALMGITFNPIQLTPAQIRALSDGNYFELTARFVPKPNDGSPDFLWRTAPAVRLADKLIREATLEGTLSRTNKKTVGWWRIECNQPDKVSVKVLRGEGGIFWSWIEAPEPGERYLRVVLHRPATRYQIKLELETAKAGGAVTILDGPTRQSELIY